MTDNYGIKFDTFSKGRFDTRQNALMMVERLLEDVEKQKRQGVTKYSFANGYYSHLLPRYTDKMSILEDNVKIKDFNKSIKDKHLIGNPRHFIDGVNTTNGRAKEGAFNTGVVKLRESGFLDNDYFKNSNNKDNIISNANDVLMVYDNALQQGIITINDKYLSASAEVSDYSQSLLHYFCLRHNLRQTVILYFYLDIP